MNFDYTKANGVTSSRVLSPVIVPNTMYEGFDITELDSEQQGAYIAQIEAAKVTLLLSVHVSRQLLMSKPCIVVLTQPK